MMTISELDGFGLAPVKPEGQVVKVESSTKPEMTCWLDLINEKIKTMGLDIVPMEHISLTDEELNKPFSKGFGSPCGKPFIGWSSNHVWFSVVYDGQQSVGVVPRNTDQTFQPVDFGGGSYNEGSSND